MISAVAVLNTLILLGVVVTAIITVFSKKLITAIIGLGVIGALMTAEFLVLHAPDVAIAEAAVGAVLSPALFIIALR